MQGSEPKQIEEMQVDLTNCDQEPIHKLGKVQSFGFLLGLTPQLVITHASNNIAEFLDQNVNDIIGQAAETLICDVTLHAIRNKLQYLRGGQGTELLSGVALKEPKALFDISVHITDQTIILECEPHQKNQSIETELSNVRGAVERLKHTNSIDQLCAYTVRFVKLLTGMDRIMLYKFLPDDSGEVIAEAKDGHVESFLGLRYPASDIPKQARALYIQNPIRMIADVSDDGHIVKDYIFKPDEETDQSISNQKYDIIDLSNSVLRSVSPIHLEYLKNMGVQASMSISIVINDKLWGLIACHHSLPITLAQSKRNAALLFAQMISLLMQSRLIEEEKKYEDKVRALSNKILNTQNTGISNDSTLTNFAKQFQPLLSADGIAIFKDGDAQAYVGETPSKCELHKILDYLYTRSDNTIFSTHQMQSHVPGLDLDISQSAGLLSIPISKTKADYLLFFRKEVVQNVKWAGNPEKPVEVGSHGNRLTPRKSFEAWKATVRWQSEEWTPAQLSAAHQIRITLLEFVLNLAEEAAQEQQVVNEKQELLIAELNHRVQNILGLVRGLISQTANQQLNIKDYIAVLDDRIHALARAHDQITKHNGSPASLKELIRVEVKSYILGKRDRVIISGQEALIDPVAFSTLALVVHEMLTNAAKYGSLSDSTGTIFVTLQKTDTQDLEIFWKETGGPKVKEPERRGFGSTIIERSIPFELKGKAQINYYPEGVEAYFLLPKAHVNFETSEIENIHVVENVDVSDLKAPKSVLVVEDNLIIAMEAEDIFNSLGAEKVRVVSSNMNALEYLKDNHVDFCLLDVNLGQETSIETALWLHKQDIPFLFATGYGEVLNCPDELLDVPCISKPYDLEMVQKSIAALSTKM